MNVRSLWTVTFVFVTGCGAGIRGTAAAGAAGTNAASAGNGGTTTVGTGGAQPSGGSGTGAQPSNITGDLRVDHFGYRLNDTKQAVVLGSAQVSVELRNAANDTVVQTLVSSGLQTDQDSGDRYSTVDFSTVTTQGEYYLYLPSTKLRSYTFKINNDVYDIVGSVAVKSFYFQRCNHDKALPYASDVLGSFKGLGGQWVDGACHLTDERAGPGPGSADDGTLDLRGGWHDAGDFQKTLWDRGVEHMLFAYELNPGAWTDKQLDLPESGNGVPDLLDEVQWELDFYVRMQRPDGHFLTSVKGHNATILSPPSACNEQRVYFDGTPPSGSDWSGGGVTPFEATANGTRALAHAAVVFGSVNQAATSSRYKTAALAGWAWLNGKTPANTNERRIELAAAAAVYRLDSGQQAAAQLVGAFNWSTWDGLLPSAVTPAENVITVAAWNTLLNPAASSTLKSTIKAAAARAIVDRAWAQRSVYGGMYGDSTGSWDWTWGSNRRVSTYGANLLIAARFGILSSHTKAEVETQAWRYLHYMLGYNPRNMVYLTNMAAYGGEHSSFQIYHKWFSYTGGDGDHGNTQYNGLPNSVDEPAYPYYRDDTQRSKYGPAPGLVPGGPNLDYSGTYVIPNRQYPAYAYRDWSVGCGWNGGQCTSSSWEITEPDTGYQAAFVLLASFAMSGT